MENQTKQDITFQQIKGSQKSSQKNNKAQKKENPQDTKFWTKKKKIALFIIVSVLIVSGVLSVVLYLRFKPNIQVINTQRLSLSQKESLQSVYFNIKERNLFEQDYDINLTFSYMGPSSTQSSRILQTDKNSQRTEFSTCISYNHEMGITYQVCDQKDVKVTVNMETIANSDENVRRLLQTTDKSQVISQAQAAKEIASQLASLIGVSSENVKTQNIDYLDLVYNDSEKKFDIEISSKNQPRILFLNSRKLFFKKIFKGIGKAVSKIVKPVINVIKKNGPLIGTVLGGIAGGIAGIAGGPAGVIAGAKAGAAIGAKIGTAAQFVANSCFPNPPRVKCTKKSVIDASKKTAINILTGAALDKVSDMSGLGTAMQNKASSLLTVLMKK